MKISCIINCDTRSGFEQQETAFTKMNEGCRSVDFLTDGVKNKKIFLDGFDIEVIVFVDEHNNVPPDVLATLREVADVVVLRKHTKYYHGGIFDKFNDINYLHAFMMARGDYIFHFDADCAAFTSGPQHIQWLISLLDNYKFVSYPSAWSPHAVNDPQFDHMWASTRFFACHHSTLDFTEIEKCLVNPDYMWSKYGDKRRRLSWMEHVLGITCGSNVFYPPIEIEKYMIFCWDTYRVGVLGHLNVLPYEAILNFVKLAGGIHYPADVKGT